MYLGGTNMYLGGTKMGGTKMGGTKRRWYEKPCYRFLIFVIIIAYKFFPSTHTDFEL